ncbi:hypothetical protein AB0907_30240 [Streptomyces sp. NPDC006975]|uniref:MmyB family transcriptional regulator n=1 Tax=Streptomyces sp. NPDC006975 TaxID=3154310 RepID=UPI00345227C2
MGPSIMQAHGFQPLREGRPPADAPTWVSRNLLTLVQATGNRRPAPLLGQFRSGAARRPTGPRFAELVGELLSDSDGARWYERRETAGFEPSVRRFRHPTVGELRLRYVELAAVDEPCHHLLAYLPDDRGSEDALRRSQAGE